MLGQRHNDIDGYFTHLSKKLKKENPYMLEDLIKSFTDSKELTFVPEYTQEAVDFESYFAGFHHEGANKIEKLGDMRLLKFYVKDTS